MPGTSSTEETIEAIRSAFGREDPSTAGKVSKQRVLQWMRSPDLNVRGCVYAKVAELETAKHIEPTLEFEDYYGFVVPYLEECMQRDTDMEWVEPRYIAGHELAIWIKSFWHSEAVPREKIAEIKERLAALYKRADEPLRDALLNGLLEHLFEDPALAEYFEDWRVDPALAQVYENALLWTKLMPAGLAPQEEWLLGPDAQAARSKRDDQEGS